jgi:hypothetical protein
MRKFIASLLALSCILIVSSCSEDPAAYTGSGMIEKLSPYAVGNIWVMEETHRDVSGITNEIDTITTTVDSAGTFNGHSGFYKSSFNHRTQKSSAATFHYYSIDDAKHSPVPVNPSVASYFIRYPSPLNEEIKIFDTTISNGEYAKIAIKLISENKTVTVPAGRFSCVVYQSYIVWGKGNQLDTMSKSRYYYSNGIGLVQTEDFSATIYGTLYLEGYSRLISYNVK